MKGERKMADDMALLLNDNVKVDEEKDDVVQDVYRITFLQYCLKLSPYNFDIQMALTLLYDKCGLSISFKEAEENP
jgi:hypothetical protein